MKLKKEIWILAAVFVGIIIGAYAAAGGVSFDLASTVNDQVQEEVLSDMEAEGAEAEILPEEQAEAAPEEAAAPAEDGAEAADQSQEAAQQEQPEAAPEKKPEAAPAKKPTQKPAVTPSKTPTPKPEQKPAQKPDPQPAQKPSVTPDPTPVPAKTVDLKISCATILKNMDKLEPAKKSLIPSNGILLDLKNVEIKDGDTAFTVLQRELKARNLHLEFEENHVYNSIYIEGICNIYEFDCGELSGWEYSVNGKFPGVGCSAYKVSAGDVIYWQYTCDLGKDIGNEYHGKS